MTDPLQVLQTLLAPGPVKTASFPTNSRYCNQPLAQMERPDGTKVAYLTRRFVPDPSRFATLRQYQVSQGDRPDLIAARAFGDPELWWRLADANGVMSPDELVETVGRMLRITLQQDVPGPVGQKA